VTSPRNDNSAKQYPNLLKECEVLTEDILAKTVGANPLDIQSTFVARCAAAGGKPGRPDRHHPILVRAGQPGQREEGCAKPEVSDRKPLDRGFRRSS